VNNFLWILLAVLALALSWFAESVALAWVTAVLILVLAASRLLVRFTPHAQASRMLSANYIHPGEKVRVWVRLHLARRAWGWLQVSDATPPLPLRGERGIMLGPAAGRDSEFSYTLEATRRGYFPVGPLNLRYGDSFGFGEGRRTLLEAESITVFPRVVEMRRVRLPIARAPGELQTIRRTFEDSTRPAGVRTYQQGDPLRRVHWRATAHSGRPQSKLYDLCTTLQALIVLNFCRPDYPLGPSEAEQASEIACSLAASLALHLLSASQRVGLISNGIDLRERDDFLKEAEVALLPESLARLSDELAKRRRIFLSPSRSPERALEMLSLLARLQPANGRALSSLLEEVSRELSWGETVVVITPSVDDSAVQALASISHAGFLVLALVVGDFPLASRAHLRLTAAGIPSRRMMREEDIGGLFA